MLATKKPHGYWTYNKLKEEAQKYKSVSDFSKNNRVALEKIQALGIYDDICSHLSRKIKKRGYWNKETIIKHARECKNRNEFQEKYNQGYRLAKIEGILDDLFGKVSQVDCGYWNNEENILEAALQCNNRKDFQIKFGSAYSAALRLNLLDCLFDKKQHKRVNSKWTLDKILEIHDSNKTMVEFMAKYPSAHKAAVKMDIWNSLEFKQTGSNYKRCIYAIEFENNFVYVGLTYDFKRRIYDHFNHKKKYSTVRNYHIKNPKLKYECIQLSEYMDVRKASIEEGEIVNIYKKDGWVILNKVKTGGVGGLPIGSNITKDECISSIKNFNTLSDWKSNNPKHFYAAKKNGWYEECKSHMTAKCKPNLYWTKERCIEDAKKYNTRKAWSTNSVGYSIAQKNKWLIICCSHMINGRIKWTKDNCIKISREYSTKNEWILNNKNSYIAARRNNWLNECCKHM